MAFTIQIQPGDLEQLRFAVSPLIELTFSYALLHKPAHQGLHPRWVEAVNQNLSNLEFPYLAALIPPKHYLADFVTPTPSADHSDIETELRRVRATPPNVVRNNIEHIIDLDGETEIRRHYLAYPDEALFCLITK